MSKDPKISWFGDSCRYHHDSYRDTFDPNDLSMEQAEYFAKHSEVTTLASLFVSRMIQRKAWCRNTLKEAALFFTRAPDILDDEIKQEQKRIQKSKVLTPRAKKEKTTIETDSFHTKPKDSTRVSFSESKLARKDSVVDSVESLYSGFVTESTSATTASVEEVPEQPTPSLTEFMYDLILIAMNNGLNEMYATRESEIVYDEAHLCLMRSIQIIVETKWNPIIDDFKELLETIVHDVRRIALQRHRMKLRAIDKVPIKVERLRNNYRGFSSEENHQPTKKEILDTMKHRKWTFNRYPKDAFGVYISSENETNSSMTSDISENFFSMNSVDSIAPSHRSYASTCLLTMPLPFLLRSGVERP